MEWERLEASSRKLDTKGTFHANMGSIKDRNVTDLTEGEDMKKRWQEYTEQLFKKDLHDPDNHYGVITHLAPGILECEVKWTLRSITMKEKHQYSILTHIYGIQKDGKDNPVCKTAKETQMYRTVFWTLWEREQGG